MKCNPQRLNGDDMNELDKYHRERARQCIALSRQFHTSAMRVYWHKLAQYHIQCALGLYFDSRVSK